MRLLAAGKARECIGYYEQALRLEPRFIDVRNFLGVAYRQLKEWPKAIDCFREAIRIDPSYAPAYNNLGNTLHAQGKWQEAITVYELALKLLPNNPDIVFNLAITLDAQGELTKAVEYYRQAIRFKPGNILARNNLADALKQLGNVAEAMEQLCEIVRVQPGYVLAHAQLINFAAEGFHTLQPNQIQAVKVFVDSGNVPAYERAFCCFALGAWHDKQGLFDEAFRYYHLGNSLRKKLLQERNLAFDPQLHIAFVDKIIATYSHAHLESVKDWGLASAAPIFIVGSPRSGSTLVEQILASHPQVFGTGEIESILDFITKGSATKNPDHYSGLLPSTLEATRKLAADYCGHLAKLSQGAARVTVKTNENYLHLGLIATMFPAARIIHCHRDPLDVCLSCYIQNFHTNDFVWSLEDIGAYYRAYEKIMAHWSRVLPIKIYDLCYEDLVHNQESAIRSMLGFCGLDWDERCLAFYNTRRTVRSASVLQVRKPMNDAAIGRWKNYRSHLGPLFQALGRSV